MLIEIFEKTEKAKQNKTKETKDNIQELWENYKDVIYVKWEHQEKKKKKEKFIRISIRCYNGWKLSKINTDLTHWEVIMTACGRAVVYCYLYEELNKYFKTNKQTKKPSAE